MLDLRCFPSHVIEATSGFVRGIVLPPGTPERPRTRRSPGDLKRLAGRPRCRCRVVSAISPVLFVLGLAAPVNAQLGPDGRWLPLVFEKGIFAKDVTIVLPDNANRDHVAGYRRGTMFRPAAGINADNPSLKFLRDQGFIDVETDDSWAFAYHTAKARELGFFADESDRKLNRVSIRLARREFKEVGFKNLYKANPLGMGEVQVFAFVVKYGFVELIAGIPHIEAVFEAKGKMMQNPDDGKWRLQETSLGDKGGAEYVKRFGGGVDKNAPGARRAAAASPVSGGSDAGRARRTMADMRAIATALEAHAVDQSKYPVAQSIDALAALLVPTYMKSCPVRDGWETPFRYYSDGNDYRLVSAGSDRQFEKGANPSTPAESRTFHEDIIFENGQFLKWPPGGRDSK